LKKIPLALRGKFFVNRNPVLRSGCEIASPGVHWYADFEQIMKIDLMNPEALSEADHAFEQEHAIRVAIQKELLNAARQRDVVAQPKSFLDSIHRSNKCALAPERIIGLG
jgi:hypothetical protein